jgi:hypothetical protein
MLPCVAKLTQQVLSIPRAPYYRVSSYAVSHSAVSVSTLCLAEAVNAGGGAQGQGAFQLDMGTEESRWEAGKSETRGQKK